MNILVSACLLGVECRYCGDGCFKEEVDELRKKHTLIPICPEQLGGLPTPRNPVEIVGGKALDKEKNDVTIQFQKGAEETLKIANILNCQKAILKSNSPSCGYGMIYDGTFSGKKIEGNGFTAEMLSKHGIVILSENDISSKLQNYILSFEDIIYLDKNLVKRYLREFDIIEIVKAAIGASPKVNQFLRELFPAINMDEEKLKIGCIKILEIEEIQDKIIRKINYLDQHTL